MTRSLTLPVVALLLGCAAPRAEQPTPQPRTFEFIADSLLRAAPLNRAMIGIEIFDRSTGRSRYSHNADTHFVPASNMKLVVTAVAMGLLGPDYRYQTSLFASGVAGDSAVTTLVIKGSGDPTWSTRFHSSDTFVLDRLADSLYAAGVRRVDTLLGDLSYLGPSGVHWTWMIGDLPETFATAVSAIAIGEGTVQLMVRAGARVGDTAQVSVLGPSDVFLTVSAMRTDTASAAQSTSVDYEQWPGKLRLTGRIGLNAASIVRIAAPDVARFALASLRASLEARGIRVGATEMTYDSTRTASLGAQRAVVTWTSPPLTDIIAGILLPSQNWIAEQLLRTLGARHGRSGAWPDAVQVERRYLIDVARLDSTAFHLTDASGLSTQNLFTPRAFVQLLEHTHALPWGAAYRAALPAPMLGGSTLSNRFQGLEGRLYAKTGSMTHVSTLSGFVQNAAGRELTFSILVNASGLSQAEVRRGMDALLNALARER